MQAFMRVLRRYAAHIHQIDEYRTSKVGSGSLQAWGHSEIVGRRLYAQPGFTAPAPQVCSACGHRPLRLIEPHMATRSRDVQACPGCGTFWVSAGGGNLSRQPVSRSDSLDRWTCMTHNCPPPQARDSNSAVNICYAAYRGAVHQDRPAALQRGNANAGPAAAGGGAGGAAAGGGGGGG